MKKQLLFLPAFFTLISACDRRSTADQQRAAMEDSIRHTLENYTEAINQNEADARFSYYDDSSAFYWIPAGSSKCLSRDSFFSYIRTQAPLKMKLSSVDLDSVTDNFVRYKARFKYSDANVSRELEEEGMMVKRGGRWKLLFGHSTELK